jgi:mannose-6-phosphate isomerase-like protein (cupin superfamily)
MTGRSLMAWTLLIFAAGVGTGLGTAPARSHANPRMWADPLLQLTTDQIPRKVTLWVSDDHWEPGAGTGRHRHPGPTVIYILEGELSEITSQGTTRLKAGQVVWRAARHEHDVRNVSGLPAHALAIHLDPAP